MMSNKIYYFIINRSDKIIVYNLRKISQKVYNEYRSGNGSFLKCRVLKHKKEGMFGGGAGTYIICETFASNKRFSRVYDNWIF